MKGSMFKALAAIFTLLVLGAIIINVTSCTEKSPACAVAKVVGSHVTDEIATQINCSNKDAIKADVDAQLMKLKVCDKVEASSVFAGLICTPLVDGLIGGAVQKIPASWGCSGGPLADELKVKLIDACKKAF